LLTKRRPDLAKYVESLQFELLVDDDADMMRDILIACGSGVKNLCWAIMPRRGNWNAVSEGLIYSRPELIQLSTETSFGSADAALRVMQSWTPNPISTADLRTQPPGRLREVHLQLDHEIYPWVVQLNVEDVYLSNVVDADWETMKTIAQNPDVKKVCVPKHGGQLVNATVDNMKALLVHCSEEVKAVIRLE
jgi:hypothetical protein